MFDEYKIPKGSIDSRIKKNVMHRQALKKKWDRHCKYDISADNANVGAAFAIDKFSEDKENWVRLLDEGVVVEGDSTPYAVIGKGVIKKWFDELPKDFEGYINKDHISGIDLGKFKKSDLRIVELGDDRYGVDVNVKLDHELYATKDLLRSMNRKAISSEFYYDADEYVKASVATGDTSFPDWFLIPKISAISLVGYAVVDNPKNANSYDEDLLKKASAEEEGETTMTEEEKKRLEAEGEIENEETETKVEETENEETEADGSDEEVEQNSTDEGTEGEAEGDDAGEEKTDEGEGEGEADGETEDKTDASADEGEDTADKLATAIESLKAENKALKEENEQLKAKLSTKEEKEADFETKLKNVLSMATASEPTEEEGADVTPDDDDKEKNSVVESYKAAFKDLGE